MVAFIWIQEKLKNKIENLKTHSQALSITQVVNNSWIPFSLFFSAFVVFLSKILYFITFDSISSFVLANKNFVLPFYFFFTEILSFVQTHSLRKLQTKREFFEQKKQRK